MRTDTGAFSGGEHSCGARRAQADRDAARVGGGVADLEYGIPVAYAAAVLPELQDGTRRFQHWRLREALREILKDLANTLREQGSLNTSECFIDVTFAAAKGGGAAVGPTKRGKGVKIMG